MASAVMRGSLFSRAAQTASLYTSRHPLSAGSWFGRYYSSSNNGHGIGGDKEDNKITSRNTRQRGQQHPGVNEGGYNRNDDRFQYDMKAPLLDAGIANIFQVDENMISIAENLPTGFRLNNGITVYGPLLVVNNEAFTLKIPPPKPDAAGKVVNPMFMLDPQALEVFNVVTPKPELVIVGGGARISPLSPDAKKYLTSIGIKVELSNTRHASSTFNTLSEEGRNAALLALPLGVDA
ncbi:hypothetical protein H4R99_006188 [Coemansia sp. RSA 1722]|nr:hypothetical protein IWW45_006613 [Coemansia sp. RSA 485]KAJ2593113.1 hypothetical protein H4R99_006188 [Coemansia sp. RSA 1722]KAJ2638493.1 hypothetical protein GGF40_001630 [Coemansia sp. RSA 1286]